MPPADLGKEVYFRGMALNDFVDSTDGKYGYAVEELDPTLVDIRQYMEPIAKGPGIDVGGIWLGARHVTLVGTVYGRTRGEAFTLMATLDQTLTIDQGTTHTFPLIFSYPTWAGDAHVTLYARCDGVNQSYERSRHGGDDLQPLAIPYTAHFIVFSDPTIIYPNPCG